MDLTDIIWGNVPGVHNHKRRAETLGFETIFLDTISFNHIDDAVHLLESKLAGSLKHVLRNQQDVLASYRFTLDRLKDYRKKEFELVEDQHNDIRLREIVDGKVHRNYHDRLESIEGYLDAMPDMLSLESLDALHYTRARLEQNTYLKDKMKTDAYSRMMYHRINKKIDSIIENNKRSKLFTTEHTRRAAKHFPKQFSVQPFVNTLSKAAVLAGLITSPVMAPPLDLVPHETPASKIVYKDVLEYTPMDNGTNSIEFTFDTTKAMSLQKGVQNTGSEYLILVDKSEKEGYLFITNDGKTYSPLESFDVGLGPARIDTTNDTLMAAFDSTLGRPIDTPVGNYRIVSADNSADWEFKGHGLLKGQKIFGPVFYRFYKNLGLHGKGRDENGTPHTYTTTFGCVATKDEVILRLNSYGVGPGTYLSVRP